MMQRFYWDRSGSGFSIFDRTDSNVNPIATARNSDRAEAIVSCLNYVAEMIESPSDGDAATRAARNSPEFVARAG